MWKAAYRPDHKISQSYNDGVVTIYRIDDDAAPGYQPKERPTELVTLNYKNRRVGVQRYYGAKQAQTEVKRVIRVQHTQKEITPQNKAVTEDGHEYRIDFIQFVPDVYPPSDDLTLVEYRQGAAP